MSAGKEGTAREDALMSRGCAHAAWASARIATSAALAAVVAAPAPEKEGAASFGTVAEEDGASMGGMLSSGKGEVAPMHRGPRMLPPKARRVAVVASRVTKGNGGTS
jgi:chitodextrinase